MSTPCESCGMPVPSASNSKFCKYCAPNGELLPLSKIIENMMKIMADKRGLTEEQAFEVTISYLKKMPMWRDKLEKVEKS